MNKFQTEQNCRDFVRSYVERLYTHMETLLNLEQAAELLNMRPTQLYELTRSRSRMKTAHPVPFAKIGKSLKFRASSLQAWVNTLESTNSAAA